MDTASAADTADTSGRRPGRATHGQRTPRTSGSRSLRQRPARRAVRPVSAAAVTGKTLWLPVGSQAPASRCERSRKAAGGGPRRSAPQRPTPSGCPGRAGEPTVIPPPPPHPLVLAGDGSAWSPHPHALKRQGGASRRYPLRQPEHGGDGWLAVPGEGGRPAPSPRPGSAAVAVAGAAAPAPPSRPRPTPAPAAPHRPRATAVGDPPPSPHRSTPTPSRCAAARPCRVGLVVADRT